MSEQVNPALTAMSLAPQSTAPTSSRSTLLSSDSDASSEYSSPSAPSAPSAKLDFYLDRNAPTEERLIGYSLSLYEYTRQLWVEARRQAELEATKHQSSDQQHRRHSSSHSSQRHSRRSPKTSITSANSQT